MGDSKKRVAGIQLTKDNPEVDDDGPEPEMGTFKRASDDVLATRKIIKVRHSQPSAATSNPFASLRMVPPSDCSANTMQLKDGADAKIGKSEENNKGTESGTLVDEPNGIDGCDKKVDEKTDTSTTKDDSNVEAVAVEEATQSVEAEKDAENGGEETSKEDKEETEKKPNEEENENENAGEEKTEKEKPENDIKDADVDKPVGTLNSFQQLSSSQNAFTGLAGTRFGTSSFSFGSMAKGGNSFCGFNTDNHGRDVTKSGVPSMQEVPVETGEENEKAVFTADAALYEYLDGGWKERGKGEIKLNVSLSDAEKARLIMRARGNYRLILNASLYLDMTFTYMDKKGITFACFNSAGERKSRLATFALKFKGSSFVEEFRGAVAAYEGKMTTLLKTPENSPKASDD